MSANVDIGMERLTGCHLCVRLYQTDEQGVRSRATALGRDGARHFQERCGGTSHGRSAAVDDRLVRAGIAEDS